MTWRGTVRKEEQIEQTGRVGEVARSRVRREGGGGWAGWGARVNLGLEVVAERVGLDKLRLLPTFASVLREENVISAPVSITPQQSMYHKKA